MFPPNRCTRSSTTSDSPQCPPLLSSDHLHEEASAHLAARLSTPLNDHPSYRATNGTGWRPVSPWPGFELALFTSPDE